MGERAEGPDMPPRLQKAKGGLVGGAGAKLDGRPYNPRP